MTERFLRLVHGDVSEPIDITGPNVTDPMLAALEKIEPFALGLRFEASVEVARELNSGSRFHGIPIWVTST